jgi:hypothetical protein
MKEIWLWVQEVGNAPTDSVPHPATFHGWYYPAAEVERLVEAAIFAKVGIDNYIHGEWGLSTLQEAYDKLSAAIAAVEGDGNDTA